MSTPNLTRPACPGWCVDCSDGGDAVIHTTRTITVVDHDNGNLVTAKVWVEQFISFTHPDKSSRAPRVYVEALDTLSINAMRDLAAAAEQLYAEATQP